MLIGMINPISTDPKHALYPLPPGCTGNRIFKMLKEGLSYSITHKDYVEAFDRRNLVTGGVWSLARARVRAQELLPELAGRDVVLFGQGVREAFGVPRLMLHPQLIGGVNWRQLPHPSGRCLWYNDKECRALASSLLAELFDTTRPLI